jgi:DNA-binding winged helix-turn-helix (wHTH) protein
MNENDKIYEFDDFYIDENERKLYRNGEYVHLQGKAFEILFLLVQHSGRFVTREEILNALWNEKYVNENVITPQITAIRNALSEELKGEFIETGNKSYKFVKDVYIRHINKSKVTEVEPQKNELANEIDHDLPKPSKQYDVDRLEFNNWQIILAITGMIYAFLIIFWGINAKGCQGNCFEQNLFTNIAGISVGLLMADCLLLECAYQFDRFGWKTLLFIPVIFLINFGSTFTGLSLANTAHESLIYSFAISLICFLAGLSLSTLITKFLLPNVPVTVARFETHPAFAAYYKNVFMYILPLYTFFCLLVNCFLFSGRRILLHPGFPISLFVVWLIFVFVSYFSTSYLLNNLLREKDGVTYTYHGFFVSLIFVRFILFFGPTFIFILWYFIQTIELVN